jgi:hypothetical protein
MQCAGQPVGDFAKARSALAITSCKPLDTRIQSEVMRQKLLFLLACICVTLVWGCGTQKSSLPVKFLLTEIEFYNELWTWDQSTKKYPRFEDFPQRAIDIKGLGDRGFLPAQAASKLLDFRSAIFRYDKDTWEKLHTTAKSGDAAAACTLGLLWSRQPVGKVMLDMQSDILPLVQRGSRQKHPVCMHLESVHYSVGRHGYRKDPHKARELLFAAAASGYYAAQIGLYVAAETSPVYDPNDMSQIEASICWLALADRHAHGSFGAYLGGLDAGLAGYGKRRPRAELHAEQQALISKWQGPPPHGEPKIQPTVQDCTILQKAAHK